jgi:hypothetical protein
MSRISLNSCSTLTLIGVGEFSIIPQAYERRLSPQEPGLCPAYVVDACSTGDRVCARIGIEEGEPARIASVSIKTSALPVKEIADVFEIKMYRNFKGLFV